MVLVVTLLVEATSWVWATPSWVKELATKSCFRDPVDPRSSPGWADQQCKPLPPPRVP